jgi:hypothetical protein
MEDLISLSKTNGQLEDVIGVKIYTIYSKRKKKAPSSLETDLPVRRRNTRETTPFSGRRRVGWVRISKFIPNIEPETIV